MVTSLSGKSADSYDVEAWDWPTLINVTNIFWFHRCRDPIFLQTGFEHIPTFSFEARSGSLNTSAYFNKKNTSTD